ncbi:DUF1330 domain-containing protein [Pseudomonas sp. zjy_15]|uniref:DUF1330 domain-containing protein n=1 Tax=unclassified Pseudomonas TaxID=196821 RepID=UPI00370A2DCE
MKMTKSSFRRVFASGVLAFATLTSLAASVASAQPQPEMASVNKPGYAVFFVQVSNPDAYTEYASLVLPSLKQYQGRVISAVSRSDMRQIEGTPSLDRAAIIEFPSLDIAEEWYKSSDYTRATEIRNKAGVSKVVLMRGR